MPDIIDLVCDIPTGGCYVPGSREASTVQDRDARRRGQRAGYEHERAPSVRRLGYGTLGDVNPWGHMSARAILVTLAIALVALMSCDSKSQGVQATPQVSSAPQAPPLSTPQDCVSAKAQRAMAARKKWFLKPNAEARGASPRDEGFDIEGACADVLTGRNLVGCDLENVLRVDGGSPWILEAEKLGFTAFTCINAGNGRRTSYPISALRHEWIPPT